MLSTEHCRFGNWEAKQVDFVDFGVILNGIDRHSTTRRGGFHAGRHP
jgi:hypothetical protein